MRKKARQLGIIKKRIADETFTSTTKSYTLDQAYDLFTIHMSSSGWGFGTAIDGSVNFDTTIPIIPGGGGAAQLAFEVMYDATANKITLKRWPSSSYSGSYYIRIYGYIL